jgi:two-component system chemotaxis sensor kinase CheA
MESGEFFGALMDDFFAEADEHLASLRRLLMELEEDPAASPFAEEKVRGVFRALHTLKGLSGMVGYAEAEGVAHALEDWLHAAVPDGIVPPGASLEPLFEGAAVLERCLQARRAGAAPAEVAGFVAALRTEPGGRRGAKARRRPPPAAAPAPAGPGLALSPAEALRRQAAAERGDRVEELEFVPTPELVARGVGVEAIRARLGEVGEILHVAPRVLPGRGVAFRFLVALPSAAALPEAWREDGLSWSVAAEIAAPAPAPPGPAGGGVAVASNVVRVALPRLEELLRLVGELVISRSRLADLLERSWSERAVPLDALVEINAAFERQLRELREGVMRVRLVAVGEPFERMRFVVREVANAEGKEVRVELAGQDTEIDKLVVERMMEPLLHLVRNAVSHGIETPAERAAAGKPPEGTLRLSAAAAGERVRIEVADDGRGIDRGAVAARGRAHGLAVPNGTPDDDALLEILCAPGFSTREVADLSSGRGVGMEVVRSTLRALGGELFLSSEAGRGTRFTVELPLTLMIVDALLVRIGEQTMAVPQPALLEVVQVEADDVVTFENNEVVRYRGKVLPLVRLRRLFGLAPNGSRASFPVLVVGSEAQPMGLAVDRLAGLREIVVRPLADPLVAVPGIAAAAELGDGRVCLILDAVEVVRLARGMREAPTPAAAPVPAGAR